MLGTTQPCSLRLQSHVFQGVPGAAGRWGGPCRQLWLIPVNAPLAALADDKAALAVSVKAPGGSKKDVPTGSVVALGKLTRIQQLAVD